MLPAVMSMTGIHRLVVAMLVRLARLRTCNPFIVFPALDRVGQNGIGGVDYLDDPDCFRAVTMAIGMVFLAERFVRSPDHLWRRVARDLEVVVVRMNVSHVNVWEWIRGGYCSQRLS